MKKFVYEILSLLKNFFLSIRIHFHVGIYREDSLSKDNELSNSEEIARKETSHEENID